MMGEGGSTLEALRIIVEGPVTSFRYPHFIQGVQPTYPMPPPATLYGHVCSALGDFVSPDSFRVALRFTFEERFTDYEHTHLFGGEPKLSPFRRELLFRPCLTLYIDRPDWLQAFRQPRYVVTLGRSQDLMCYRRVEVVSLQRSQTVYVEQTLLPYRMACQVDGMVALTMPRFVDARRVAQWDQYAMIRERHLLYAETDPQWFDPDAPTWRGAQRAVVWLSFDSRP